MTGATPSKPASVAVVIPAYNAASFIRNAIESVLSQTLQPDEVIVVDDGSSDDTRRIVAAYGPYVTLLEQQNGGPAAARNFAVRSSTSRYIAFLDADDTWSPDKLERQIRALEESPRAILCYTGLMLVHPDGRETPARVSRPSDLGPVLRMRNPSLAPSCVVVTREALQHSGGFHERHRGSEDWELWFRLWQVGPFLCVNAPLTNYRVSVSGLSGDADHMMRDFQQMLEPVLLNDLHGPRRHIWRRRILSEQCFRAALTARASQNRAKAIRYHIHSLLLWPSPLQLPYRLYALGITLRGARRETPQASLTTLATPSR